jgi:hypothetical protein
MVLLRRRHHFPLKIATGTRDRRARGAPLS